MNARRTNLVRSLLLLAVTFAAGYAVIRSPVRVIFVVFGGLALFAYLILRKPRTGPTRWSKVLFLIAMVQLLVILLLTAFSRLIARLSP